MNKRTHRNLTTAHRVFDLSQKHASDARGYVEALGQFKEKLAQADALAECREGCGRGQGREGCCAFGD